MLQDLFEPIRAEMAAKHLAREEALRGCRLLIQTCSKCIKCVHRGDFEAAREHLAWASEQSRALRQGLTPHPDLLYAGYLQDAEKEMVEAAFCLAVISDGETPTLSSLGVGAVSFLNGLGEAASELRRTVLDAVRKGDLAKGEKLLQQMEAFYDELTTFDYPDSLTGGLRRTCDALRAVIERTRSDLTLTFVQLELTEALRKQQPS